MAQRASQGGRRQTGRPRSDVIEKIAERANTSESSVRSFFSRPQRLSAALRQDIAEAVAHYGYRPRSPRPGPLAGRAVGFEVPRVWSEAGPNVAHGAQWLELTLAAERRSGHLVPFVVDPEVHGMQPVAGGSPAERGEGRAVAYQAWLREYATALGPTVYERVARTRRLHSFVLIDPRVGDPRLRHLAGLAYPHVVIGQPAPGDGSFPYVDMDYVWGIQRMIERLWALGCRRIGHHGFTDDCSTVPILRAQAVRALLGARFPRARTHYEGERTAQVVERLAGWLRREQPEAVVCDCDDYAALVAAAAPLAGRTVARTLESSRSLVLAGIDDAPSRQWSPVPWMTLRPPYRAMAESALGVVAEQIEGRPARSELIRPEII